MPRCTMPPSSAPRTHFGRGWWISAHIVPNRISLLILTTDFEGATVDIVKGNMGWIEVIVGPMFSGKSEELIRRLRRAEIARQRVQIFKPAIDQRHADKEMVSHSGVALVDGALRRQGNRFPFRLGHFLGQYHEGLRNHGQ